VQGHEAVLGEDCRAGGDDGLVEGISRVVAGFERSVAGAMAEDRERCVQAGMDDYVSKPFRPAQLYAMLDKYLGRVRPREQEQLIGAAPPKVDLGVAEVD
jgi:hypothetical protein